MVKEDKSVVGILSALIQDEWEAVTGYENAINDINNSGEIDEKLKEEIFSEIKDIVGEENIHVGQLQKLIDKINPTYSEKQEEGKNHDAEVHDDEVDDFLALQI